MFKATKKITLCTMVMAVSFAANAQKKWTLRECVDYAVEHNLTIEQAELDLKTTELDRKDAIGNFVPSLNGSASLRFNKGLTQNYVSGSNQVAEKTIANFTTGLNSSITLFDGLRNFNTLNRAKLNILATKFNVEDIKDDIRLSVANAYLQVLAARETMRTLQAQYNISQKDLEKTKILVENGSSPKGDVLEVEATLANQEQQIVDAENNMLIAKIGLAQLLQITDYENFEIADNDYMVPPSDILSHSADEIYNKAVTFRNDIKYADANVDVAKMDLKIANGAKLPSLTFGINYNTAYSNGTTIVGYSGDEGNLQPVYGTIPFKDQLWQNDGIYYGFSLNVPILNGFSARNNSERSKINVQRSELQLEQAKLALQSDVNKAYTDVKGKLKAFQAAQKNVDARRVAYDYSKERYNVGLLNGFEYSQSQLRLDDAEANLIKAKYDYIFSLKVLEFYFGIPLDEL
ncbi:TolC family protein [Zhouia sp. PK063]|uniref:TolC family protein n=1 Tax=Zhouia sp. PK063 TaxID=3373602 RepID=UPI0037B145DE